MKACVLPCGPSIPLLTPPPVPSPLHTCSAILHCPGAMFHAFRLMCPPCCPPPSLPVPFPLHTCSVIVHCPDAISHTSAVESMLPLASVFPSGENATLRTESVWPWTRCGDSVQKMRLVSERMIVRFT